MDIWKLVEVGGIAIFAILPTIMLASAVSAIKAAAKDLAAIKKLLAEQKGAVETISDNLAEVGNHIIERG